MTYIPPPPHDEGCRRALGFQKEPDPTCGRCAEIIERYERIAGHAPKLKLPTPVEEPMNGNGTIYAPYEPAQNGDGSVALTRVSADVALSRQRRRLRRELKVLELVIQGTMAFTATMFAIGFIGFVALIVAVVSA